MRYIPTARRLSLAPALGLLLVSVAAACSSHGSSPQGPQGSFSAAASSVHPTAPSLPGGTTAATSAPAAAPTPAAGTSGGSGTGGAVAQITANWITFFKPSTPDSERVKLLENGSQFAAAIRSFSASPLATAVSAKVDSVSVTSASKAAVRYDLTALGTAVATGSTGSSVRQDGTWKVGDDVFCGLLSKAKGAGMTVTVPAACKSAG